MIFSGINHRVGTGTEWYNVGQASGQVTQTSLDLFACPFSSN